jgi:hypothetical protein
MLGDSAGLAVAATEPLMADRERLLGADHPNTLLMSLKEPAVWQTPVVVAADR